MRPLRHSDHLKFVQTEGWTNEGTSRSRGRTGDHHRFTLGLANGEVLYTRISHGSGQIDDLNLVATILRDQLRVTETDFYRCVDDSVLPPRPDAPRPETPPNALDGKLVRNLIKRVGLSQQDVAGMTKEEAVQAWNDFLTGDQS